MNSQYERFMKKNKVEKEEIIKFAPSRSFIDPITKKPIEWTFKRLKSIETDKIRESATIDVPVEGKRNMYRPKLDINKYMIDLVIASTVDPNLNDKDLQDSYGVMDAKSLLYAMIDDTGELGKLEQKVQELSGIGNMENEIKEAKN